MPLRALFLVLHAFLSFAEFFSHLLVAGCNIEVQISILQFIQLSVFPFFINYIKVCFSAEVIAVSVLYCNLSNFNCKPSCDVEKRTASSANRRRNIHIADLCGRLVIIG